MNLASEATKRTRQTYFCDTSGTEIDIFPTLYFANFRDIKAVVRDLLQLFSLFKILTYY